MSDNNLSLIVHHYTYESKRILTQELLIEEGRDIAESANSSAGWVNVPAHIPLDISDYGKNSYEYLAQPPVIKASEPAYGDLKEWGDLEEDPDECFSLEDFKEFSVGDTDYGFAPSIHLPVDISQPRADVVSPSELVLEEGHPRLSSSSVISYLTVNIDEEAIAGDRLEPHDTPRQTQPSVLGTGPTNLTVHQFTADVEPRPSSSKLLKEGKDLVEDAILDLGWRYVQFPTPFSFNRFVLGERSHEYSLKPPIVEVSQSLRDDLSGIPEWGTLSTIPDEEFTLEELEEFQSSSLLDSMGRETNNIHAHAAYEWISHSGTATPPDLGGTVPPSPQAIPLHVDKKQKSMLPTEDNVRPRKRRRIATDSLLSLLPKPHYHSPTFVISSSPLPSIAEYQGTLTPIAPHTPESIQDYLSDIYSRCAWVIPIRGAPPYLNCTHASILSFIPNYDPYGTTAERAPNSNMDIEVELPTGPASTTLHQDAPGEITWTVGAVKALWDDLLVIRDGGVLGPVALSLHIAHVRAGQSSSLEGLSEFNILGLDSFDQTRTGVLSSRDSQREDGLRDIDYLKVYVDAPSAMKLRSVLHLWRYTPSQPIEAPLHEEQKKNSKKSKERSMRMLKGAQLVLLDEVSQGLLVC